MTEEREASVPAALPFWLRPRSILGRSLITTFIESSHLLAMPSTLAPHRLMLADTSLPHGQDAPEVGRDTLSEGFRRFVALPPYLLGYG